ncbi:MAG TPA: GNAT family N-acetyltransferase [Pyrinomonadaceae bacterium]|nr:GNAT family N-acetyltransferase [Pyrinomonadaceae bacterium]
MLLEHPEVYIREATANDAAAVAEVHVNSWKGSFSGIVPDAFLDKLTIETRTKAFRERFGDANYQMYVAELDDGHVVGFADVGEPRHDAGEYDAELYAIYLLNEFQGKGIGALLFQRVKEFVIARGKESMYLLALEVSPYRPFYEKMGGRVVGKKQVQLEGIEFHALIYGWERLS